MKLPLNVRTAMYGVAIATVVTSIAMPLSAAAHDDANQRSPLDKVEHEVLVLPFENGLVGFGDDEKLPTAADLAEMLDSLGLQRP